MKPTTIVLVLAGAIGAYFLMQTVRQPAVRQVPRTGPAGSAGPSTEVALIQAGAQIITGWMSRIGSGGDDGGGGDVPDPDFEIEV